MAYTNDQIKGYADSMIASGKSWQDVWNTAQQKGVGLGQLAGAYGMNTNQARGFAQQQGFDPFGKVDMSSLNPLGTIEQGYGGGELFDQNNNRMYMPIYSTGRYEGADNYIPGELTGYRGYDWSEGMYKDNSQMNGTPYDVYDAQGKKTGGGTWTNLADDGQVWRDMLKAAAVMAAVYGGGTFLEGLSGGAATTAAGGVTGGSGAFLGEGVLSGVPAWDAAALNSGLTLTAPGMQLVNPGGSEHFLGEGMASGVPAWDAAAANAGLGLTVAPGVELLPELLNEIPSGSIPNNPVPGVPGQPQTLPPVDTMPEPPPADIPDTITPPPAVTPPGTVTPPPTIPGGPGGTPGGIDLGQLVNLLGGFWDKNNQQKASQQMLDYLKERQSINDGMYAPGSNEYNYLWNEMSRKDAAAGRNSQYGPRSVDLASKVAKLKMDANTQMTTGIGSLYKNAIDQNASSNAGIMAALAGLGGGNGLQLSDVTGLWDTISGLFE